MPIRRALAAALLVLLTGCVTGERPYFSDSALPQPTGDPAVDAVLVLLDNVSVGPTTATYDVLTKFGNTTTTAVVALDAGKRMVTVGNTRYAQTPDAATTCTVDGSQPCSQGWDVSRISNTLLTVDFYAADTAKRLRRDAAAKVAPTTARTETIAGVAITCVDVPLGGGTAVYCATANGMLGLLDDGDVRVALTMLLDQADPSLFATGL